jgi:hypothetical protein
VTDVNNPTEKKRSGKRKHSKIDDLKEVGDNGLTKEDKKSKRRKREAEPTTENEGDGEGQDKRKKKNKDVPQTEIHEVSDIPKKKKHKNKTGFPDPNEDESLHDQSLKCLHYFSMHLKKLTAPHT